jgi:choline dehydrogenase
VTEVLDDVVVGAGSAGCVIARRLVDAGRRVLLLDAGVADTRADIGIAARFSSLWESAVYRVFWTEP